MQYRIAVLPGDGIGPEVTAEGTKILDRIGRKFNHSFSYSMGAIGGNAIDSTGSALPPSTLDSARKSDAVLLGAVGGPKWDNPLASVRPEDGLLAIRKELSLFANIRPVKVFQELKEASPLKPHILEGVDFVVIRELTGGLYFGKPKRRWRTKTGKRRAIDSMAYSEEEILRVLRVGFELARGRRKHLTSVDKANVLESSRLWRELAQEIAPQYPDVELQHMLVDTAAMQLVRAPARFDVIVTENTFGDIISDEASVLCGSLGMLPSASLSGLTGTTNTGSQSVGLYEPIHGSAPDIAGKGIANPIGTILSGAMLLRYSLGLHEEAHAIEEAVEGVLADGYKTADIAGVEDNVVSTREIGDVIAGSL